MNFSQLSILQKLGREFGHEQIRDAGFTDTEHGICTFLCFHDRVSQDAIANALLLDKTTVAKALSQMEAKHLIIREQNGQNRRENIIQISDKGKASVETSIHIYDDWLAEICSCLTQEELHNFDDYFGRIIENAIQHREKYAVSKGQKSNGKIQ